jgi:hypothetical protein
MSVFTHTHTQINISAQEYLPVGDCWTDSIAQLHKKA